MLYKRNSQKYTEFPKKSKYAHALVCTLHSKNNMKIVRKSSLMNQKKRKKPVKLYKNVKKNLKNAVMLCS